jgi:hypothetical protein
MFTKCYKGLERILYVRGTLKKRTKSEVTWLFTAPGHGQMEWVDKYLNSYNTITKIANYCLGFTGDKNIVYDNFHTNEKYSDLLQMFTDNDLKLMVKYRYCNFFPEELIGLSSALWILPHLTALTLTVCKCM